jgi:hypothetical protein
MVKIMNLLTIADGFGAHNLFPDWYPDYTKWPELIRLMTRGVNVVNLSHQGVGNEYIAHRLRNNVAGIDAALIQWVPPDRLDLVLAHQPRYEKFWTEQIASDPVYNNNVVQVDQHRMWISSVSKIPAVTEYHQKYINMQQHQLRSQLFVDYATLLLKNIKHGFLLTKTSKYLEHTVSDHSRWIWHEKFQGMCEFRHVSRYAELDLGITQPIPLIQFDFVRQFIQTKFDLPWRSERDIQAVENMLFRKYQEAIKKRPL